MKNRGKFREYGDIGAVEFVQSPRARRISIRVNHRGEVKVTLPCAGSMRQAEAFLVSRKQCILRSRARLNDRELKGITVKSNSIRVRGRELCLKPLNGQISGEELEEAIWRAILPPAREYLAERTRMLAAGHGISIEGIRVRRMRTRWGSCSSRNRINLNSWLVMIPEHLSDYVILHELAHTRHRNHGTQFWSLVDQMTGGQSALLRKELHTYGIMSVNTED